MVGAWSQKLVRFWKRTGTHHQPSRIALAVALGLAVGLIPKTSGIGLLLCLGLLTLPIHNLTAILVCALISPWAGRLDPLTHSLGTYLLESPSLLRFWQSIETTPLLPWLGLQNTVTVGAVTVGCLSIGPGYAISIRLIDRIYLSVDDDAFIAPPIRIVHTAHDAFPRPHFTPQPRTPVIRSEEEDSQDDSSQPAHAMEPAEAGTETFSISVAPINDWHIGLARDRSRSVHLIGAPQTTAAPQDSSSAYLMSSAEIVSDGYRTLPGRAAADSPRSSIDVMSDASDMLAWVDEAIEDCLALDRRIDAGTSSERFFEPPIRSRCDEIAPESPTSSVDEQWLMETTIEIVRWADSVDLSTAEEPFQCDVVSPQSESGSDHAYCLPMHGPVDAMRSRADSSASGSIEQVGGNILNLPSAQGYPGAHGFTENIENMQTASVALEQPMNTVVLTSAQSERQSSNDESESAQQRRRSLVVSTQRGEALSYLIQHLREHQDGSGQ